MNRYDIAVGAYGRRDQETLLFYDVDFDKKIFTKKAALSGLLNPSYLAPSKDSGKIYVAEEDPEEGFLAIVDIRGQSPVLVYEEHVNGADPCHVSLDEKEEFLIVSIYSSLPSRGGLNLYSLDKQGIPSLIDLRRPEGKGKDPVRQLGSHCHSAYIHGDRVDACDLGTDSLYSFDLDRASGKLYDSPRTINLPPRSGPRHLCFSCGDPDWFYLIGEMDANVRLFHQEQGMYVELQSINTLPSDTPPDVRAYNRASAIKMSEDEHFLLVTNRLDDSITLLEIGEDHRLRLLDIVKSGSTEPRELTVLGDYLLVGHQDGHCICAFYLDRAQGKLRNLGMKLEMEVAPVCIVEGGL